MFKAVRWSLALIFILPLVFLALLATQWEWHKLGELWNEYLWVSLRNTVVLGLLISVLSSILGFSFAYLVREFEFPFKKIISWLLILPLAVPLYAYAFSYLGFFEEFFGLWGKPYWLFVLIFVSATVPYSYLIASQFFKMDIRSIYESSRMMGVSSSVTLFKVILPVLLPSFIGAQLIVFMEFMSEMAVPVLFNINTLASFIYKSWSSFFSIQMASVVSLLLLVLVFAILIFQKKNTFYTLPWAPPPSPKKAIWPMFLLLAWVGVSFIVPMFSLVYWYFQADASVSYSDAFLRTMGLALVFSLSLTALVLLIEVYDRRSKQTDPYFWMDYGYAVPGALLAVAVLAPMFYMRRWFPDFSGGAGFVLFMWMLAWAVKYFRVAHEPVHQQAEFTGDRLAESAKLLSQDRLHLWKKFYIPLMRPGIVTALILVFLESIKELPISLLVRPYGWDTLSIKVFHYTLESEWDKAAGPALWIVVLGIVGLILVKIFQGKNHVS